MFSLLPLSAWIVNEWIVFVGLVKHNTFPQPLSTADETYYLEQFKQDHCHYARNKLIEHNLRLVAHIVKKYQQTQTSTEDLISIGTIGLIKGIDTYKIGKGTKLATYAARCIENELLMYFRSLKKVNKDVSLYQPIGQDHEGNEIQLVDVIQAENEAIDDVVAHKMEWNKIKQYMYILNDREQFVLKHRFGVNNLSIMTQREIAKELSISRSYVSRIEKRALLKLFRAYQTNKESGPLVKKSTKRS